MAGMGHASRSRGSKMLLEGVRSMGQEMGPVSMSRARRPPSKASVSAVCGDTTLLSAPLRAGVMDAGATEAGSGEIHVPVL
mmetsp:Transcript_21613/g.59947  ORF Transcript_21613/g.59947 Transcript_21613/m.59947 type:complete len:81 (-) Transcript_21613:48-290(-)